MLKLKVILLCITQNLPFYYIFFFLSIFFSVQPLPFTPKFFTKVALTRPNVTLPLISIYLHVVFLFLFFIIIMPIYKAGRPVARITEVEYSHFSFVWFFFYKSLCSWLPFLMWSKEGKLVLSTTCKVLYRSQ